MKAYQTIHKIQTIENVVKKSRFIGIAFPCDSEETFNQELDYIRQEYPGARHYCYAYRWMENILIERYQDDKEPTGTAGVPILEVLKGKELQQCAVVVVRYFGGTLLGTGGLSRAYSEAARDAIDTADIVSVQEAVLYSVTIDYSQSGKVEYWIHEKSIALIHTDYGEKIAYLMVFPKEEEEIIIQELTNQLSGQVEMDRKEVMEGIFSKDGFERLMAE